MAVFFTAVLSWELHNSHRQAQLAALEVDHIT